MADHSDNNERKLGSLETANISWEGRTPHANDFDDIYFSASNGLGESQYVFIDGNKLSERWASLAPDATFTIAETGFGSGLNFLASANLWLEQAPDTGVLHFVSIEKYPLSHQHLSTALAACPSFSTLATQLLAHYPPPLPGFHRLYLHDKNHRQRIALTLIFADAEQALSQLRASDHPDFNRHNNFTIDAWFLDGFAPAKNPNMWTDTLFAGMASLSGQHTTFSTFTAASMVRRGLQSAGFKVSKVAGYQNKREMLAGIFSTTNGTASDPQKGHQPPTKPSRIRKGQFPPPWHICRSITDRATPRDKTDSKQAAVIGGGIAGCSTALALAQRGWQVTIYEKAATLAAGASGNPQGIIYPRLSTEASFLSRFNLAALIFAAGFYGKFWDTGNINRQSPAGERCGILVLPENASDQQIFARISRNFSNCQQFVSLLDSAQLQAVSGVNLEAKTALYFPNLGWIKPGTICEQLVKHRNIHVEQADISALHWDTPSNSWHLQTGDTSAHAPQTGHSTQTTLSTQNVYSAKTVILAASHHIENFEQTQHLPLNAIRGQISMVPATTASRQLKTVICGAGYLAPATAGFHTLGATYNLDTKIESIRKVDHQSNLQELQCTDPALAELLDHPGLDALGGRASLRCTTPDYLPIVGPAPIYAHFLNDFTSLRHNARADIPHSGSYWPGLYIHCGLGSRGFSYAPLGAELLADLITNNVPALPRNLQIALHPARFIIRDLKRKRI
ncbi:MAG: bifunctional tRNA (5-methylaminomethyl-2-thiouridine)(34)-methyltransferase MnmD/FAD-dependent 5-carboxymethylaminomethyl-2-thiouridine(34) oxidoreductase MnmC [Gammaproteobacteria bacterium]|nr:MAG: bifunctional tRNA (5-methylaminomethyl-2-thiouridine)(34)-methyltransferase MnmD/FAD-dependent 5-carboxymethylaminomethyl-2-thiouridine(34) oxidoreductase MnmC [Gammaproteobacteria bacterium]